MKSGIYKISNIVNSKSYIGSAIYIKSRWATRRSLLRANKHSNYYLQASWNKHGESNFKFEILEYCSKEQLLKREQIYLDWIKPKYNLILTAGNALGFKHKDKSKELMKKPKSEAHKLAISEARKGMKFSKDHINNISFSKKGKSIDGSASAKSRLGKKRGKYKSTYAEAELVDGVVIKVK